MRKYIILIFVAILSVIHVVWAQNMQRGAVMPGFFVPNGALSTTRKQESLPPIESIQYKKKMSTAIQEENKRREQQRASAAAKARQQNAGINQQPAIQSAQSAQPAPTNIPQNSFLPTKSVQSVQNKTQPVAVENVAINTPPEPMQSSNTSDKHSNTEVAASPATSDSENKQTASVSTAPTTETASKQDDSEDVFAMIFKDYERDIVKISQNQPINNKRLEKALADYQDKMLLF